MSARTILECGGRSHRFGRAAASLRGIQKRWLRPPHSKILILLFAIACHRAEVPARPNVILISIDTLRSDHLPAYGYKGITTPAIDRLAADGVVYERAFSHVPLTLPSHASIFTGLLPAHHGVRDNAAFQLDLKTPTLASMLRTHGYATGGAVSAYVLRASTNIGTGFDAYDDRIAVVGRGADRQPRAFREETLQSPSNGSPAIPRSRSSPSSISSSRTRRTSRRTTARSSRRTRWSGSCSTRCGRPGFTTTR